MTNTSNNNTANNISFDSYFTETIVDPNGISVVDMNAGLYNLYAPYKENAKKYEEAEEQAYLVSAHEEAYPDLVAMNSILNDSRYWWWVLLLNRLDDALKDIKQNWIYTINSTEQVNEFIETTNTNNSTKEENRIGTVIELN